MNIEILPVNRETLLEYSTVPISFEIKSKYIVERLDGETGFRLHEEKVRPSQFYDYDVIDGEGPTRWAKRFDTSSWKLFEAKQDGIIIGGATVVVSTPHVFMLDDRDDLAVLWDMRVRIEYRRTGVGTTLFTEAAKWSRANNCRQLKIETQNINVPACRFYLKKGCHLGGVNYYHYMQNPLTADQVQLLWYLDL